MNVAYSAMSSRVRRFPLRDFIFPSNLRWYPCTHVRVCMRELLCRLRKKYGVQLEMNYDRDFSSSRMLRESHRDVKLVGVSIARRKAERDFREPLRNYIATIAKKLALAVLTSRRKI